jgi:hypothetical protein
MEGGEKIENVKYYRNDPFGGWWIKLGTSWSF